MPHDPSRRHSPAGSWQEAMRQAGPYMGLGMQMALTMVVFTLGGYFLDQWLNTSPWFIILGAVVGMVLVFVYLIQVSNRLGKEERGNEGKSGRVKERRSE
ncbi:MAG TPA: AtpZ/AtpI family protein [Rhodothermales bacterium]|nr:AtpZ/AtpI family protein [Rhodothermales bacterium]